MNTNIAVIQMTSTQEPERNLETALDLAGRAAQSGADIVALPENWLAMRDPDGPPPAPVNLDGPELNAFRDLARGHGIHILCGTVPEIIPDQDKIHNTSVMFGPDGNVVAVYRKIHLFDISLASGESHKESAFVKPGEEVVTADMPFGRAGLSVCYDLRFPELYRRLAMQGALLLFVPAAFTRETGRDHWLPLLRARAIENLCYVAAPAQYGRHAPNRRTFGRSVIIDPWGTVLAQAPDKETFIMATLDFDHQKQLRRQLPCLDHTKDWLFP